LYQTIDLFIQGSFLEEEMPDPAKAGPLLEKMKGGVFLYLAAQERLWSYGESVFPRSACVETASNNNPGNPSRDNKSSSRLQNGKKFSLLPFHGVLRFSSI
jgi:hypothetical protein